MTQTNRSRSPSTEWGIGLSEEDRQAFLKRLKDSPLQSEQLRKLISRRLEDLASKERDEDTYKNNSYAYWQAHVNGRKAELQYILDLVSYL